MGPRAPTSEGKGPLGPQEMQPGEQPPVRTAEVALAAVPKVEWAPARSPPLSLITKSCRDCVLASAKRGRVRTAPR